MFIFFLCPFAWETFESRKSVKVEFCRKQQGSWRIKRDLFGLESIEALATPWSNVTHSNSGQLYLVLGLGRCPDTSEYIPPQDPHDPRGRGRGRINVMTHLDAIGDAGRPNPKVFSIVARLKRLTKVNCKL